MLKSWEVDEMRNKDRSEEFQIALKISATKLIGPLFPLLCFVDFLCAPEHFGLFFGLRMSVTFYSLVIFIFAKNKVDLFSLKCYSLILIGYPALIVTVMIFFLRDISSIYFIGLNLIAAGAISFFPWAGAKSLGAVTAVVYLPYMLLPLFVEYSGEQLKMFAVNCIFIFSTVVVSFVIKKIYETLKRNEILLRMDLKNEIENRNKTIEHKTREAIRLGTLSRQFSPQVVKAIQGGDLDISKSVIKTPICAIFVDIVNSTEKVNRIDGDALNAALSLFMNDTMSVLLKYDITIDKFLGDGILAFSNAPISQKNYVKRVVDAGIEISARIVENQDKYIRHWGNRFKIRIGVDCGQANVGFYGSRNDFRSYTAIGSVVNLASRLCGAGTPNEITVSENVFKELEKNKDYIFTNKPPQEIKGFENKDSNFYSVTTSHTKMSSRIPYCPAGHGILALNVNDLWLYEFKCRNCDHVENSLFANP